MSHGSLRRMSELCAWLVAHGSSCAEVVGFITGVLNVWLVTRENIWSWPVGIVNAAFYIVVFAQAGLYSDTGLQAVYLGLSAYGWWHWASAGTTSAVTDSAESVSPGAASPGPTSSRRPAANSTTALPVTRTTARLTLRLLGVGLALWLLLSVITSQIPNAKLPWFDSALVAASLVAQWMMTRKLRECWIVWIAVDALYVGLFILRGLHLTAVLYFAFFLLAILGLVQWTRSARRSTNHSHVSY